MPKQSARCLRLLALLLVACTVATRALAADVHIQSSTNCPVTMSGPVEPGDLEKVMRVRDRFPGQTDPTTSNQIVCLSGPGGSYAEALALAEYFYREGIGTRIEPGEQCYSACALLFLFGTVYFYEGVGDGHNANRSMHFTSVLGFHRPELHLNDDDAYGAKDLELAFDAALSAALGFLEISNYSSYGSQMVPSDLVAEIFSHKGDRFFYIDTVGKAARWNIGIDGLDLPTKMGPEEAYNVCNNLGQWPRRYLSDAPIHPGYPNTTRVVEVTENGLVFLVYGAYQGDAEHVCLVKLNDNGDGSADLFACGMLGMENQTIGAEICVDERGIDKLSRISNSLSLFPANLPLLQVNTEARNIEAAAALYEAAGEYRDRTLRSDCVPKNSWLTITNVQEFATLRSMPGFEKPTVAEISFNTSLRLADPGIALLGTSETLDQCRRACTLAQSTGSLSVHDIAVLDACFDQNVFWYLLETWDKEIGYVSGRYLRY